MNNEESHNEAQRRKLLSRLWSLWISLVDRLPDWIFASEAESTPLPPKPEDPKYGEEFESYKLFSDQRKAFHDETSKTIRSVFYALVGACLFCVITLAGSPDVQLLTSEATVKLPALNYDIGFKAFLVVGPVFLIALTIYLHIFVGQHRMLVMASESRQPMLPNFGSWTARLVVLVIFYWMVPVTLAVFAWKAWPRPYWPLLGYVTLGVAAGLVLLQIRRCPREWRGWGLPLLVAAFAIFCQQMFSVTTARQLNLFKADLSEKDLRATNLSDAFLTEANLSGAILFMAKLPRANLSGANLSKTNLSAAKLPRANLSRANLSGASLASADLRRASLAYANLSGASLHSADLRGASLLGANLYEADLRGAKLSKDKLYNANLSKANLLGADLSGAKLSGAKLPGVKLSGADLSAADLSEADLSEADLSEADLSEADLSEADLSGADLSEADLSEADLSGTNVVQGQLEQACGDEHTILPAGLIINPCSKD